MRFTDGFVVFLWKLEGGGVLHMQLSHIQMCPRLMYRVMGTKLLKMQKIYTISNVKVEGVSGNTGSTL